MSYFILSIFIKCIHRKNPNSNYIRHVLFDYFFVFLYNTYTNRAPQAIYLFIYCYEKLCEVVNVQSMNEVEIEV